MKKLIIVFAMLFSINSANATNVGQDAPNFVAKTLKGEEVNLASYRGKKAVWLVFWATWCPNCKREIPALKKMHANYSDEIEIIAVNVGVSDSIENSKNYAKEYDIPYKIVFSNEIANQYEIRGTPTQVGIDINGIIIYRGINVPRGFSNKEVQKLLGK